MRPAEYRTAHDSLGIPTRLLAERTGVTVGRIWNYESPARRLDVPDRAAQVMRQLQIDFEEAANAIEDDVRVTNEGWIPRHATLAEFEQWVPSLKGWGALSQGLVLAEVQRRLQAPIEWVVPA